MKKLIIVCGSPAVGKSTYAAKLAAHLPAIIVDIDVCTERMIQTALKEAGKDPNDRDSMYFKQTFRLPIYETLFDIARGNLDHTNVIIVGPFTKEIRDKDWPDKIEKSLGVRPEVHYLRCDPQVRRERMQSRANLRDQLKLNDWEKSQNYYGSEDPPSFPHIIIDTSNE